MGQYCIPKTLIKETRIEQNFPQKQIDQDIKIYNPDLAQIGSM